MFTKHVSHCMKSVRIRDFSGLNTEKYGVSLRIQSKCWKIRTREITNTNTFHAVSVYKLCFKLICKSSFSPEPRTYIRSSKDVPGRLLKVLCTLWVQGSTTIDILNDS